MIIGTNTFSVLATDVSGNAVAVTGAWSMVGNINGNIISATPVVVYDGYGVHRLTIDVPHAGQGWLLASNTQSNISLTDNFKSDQSFSVYSVDDVFASVARQSNDSASIKIGNYEELDAGSFKRGDDISYLYVVPDAVAMSISGWTDFKAYLKSVDALTSDVSAYVPFSLSVDVANKSIAMSIAASASSLLVIPDGQSSSDYYTDLQATTAGGKIKTLSQLKFTIVRDITNG